VGAVRPTAFLQASRPFKERRVCGAGAIACRNRIVVAGRGHPELSAEVVENLQVPLGECVLSTFANGEIYCRYGESIRGADVFVFQTHGPGINDLLMNN